MKTLTSLRAVSLRHSPVHPFWNGRNAPVRFHTVRVPLAHRPTLHGWCPCKLLLVEKRKDMPTSSSCFYFFIPSGAFTFARREEPCYAGKQPHTIEESVALRSTGRLLRFSYSTCAICINLFLSCLCRIVTFTTGYSRPFTASFTVHKPLLELDLDTGENLSRGIIRTRQFARRAHKPITVLLVPALGFDIYLPLPTSYPHLNYGKRQFAQIHSAGLLPTGPVSA